MLLLFCLLAQDFTVLDSGRRDANDAVYERITDEAALKALWERLPSSQMKKEMPKVDFRTNMVLVVAPSADADRTMLRIDSLKQEKGMLTLTYALTPLTVDGGPGRRIPYLLLVTPRSKVPVHIVEFVKDRAGRVNVTERAMKTIEAIK
jgi:hypothetical protein